MTDFKYNVNPMRICTQIHGAQNVNDVRDCVMNNITRLVGPLCPLHTAGLEDTINEYFVQILRNAGKNPSAVKLAIPPSHLQPRFFFDLYEKHKDKQIAYKYCLSLCKNNKDCYKNCTVDRESICDN